MKKEPSWRRPLLLAAATLPVGFFFGIVGGLYQAAYIDDSSASSPLWLVFNLLTFLMGFVVLVVGIMALIMAHVRYAESRLKSPY